MKKAILRVFFKPLTIINRIKKKDEKLIFFYSNLGFRDNVKAFYDYLIENNYNEQFKIDSFFSKFFIFCYLFY